MKKYWQIVKINIIRAINYREALIIYRLSNFLILIVVATVWLTAIHSGLIGGFTTGELLTYYVAGMVLTPLVMWTADNKISMEINSGELATNFLTKPISYYWSKYFAELGWHTISPLFAIGSLMLALLLFGSHLSLALTPIYLIFTILAIGLTATLFFSMTYLIGLLSFWFTDIEGFGELFWMLIFLFAGQGIPISFYPQNMQNILLLLPFRFLFSFPLEIFLHKITYTQVFSGFILQIAWILIFMTLAKKALQSGLKIYSAFGN